jgi:hypothetical protein
VRTRRRAAAAVGSSHSCSWQTAAACRRGWSWRLTARGPRFGRSRGLGLSAGATTSGGLLPRLQRTPPATPRGSASCQAAPSRCCPCGAGSATWCGRSAPRWPHSWRAAAVRSSRTQ